MIIITGQKENTPQIGHNLDDASEAGYNLYLLACDMCKAQFPPETQDPGGVRDYLQLADDARQADWSVSVITDNYYPGHTALCPLHRSDRLSMKPSTIRLKIIQARQDLSVLQSHVMRLAAASRTNMPDYESQPVALSLAWTLDHAVTLMDQAEKTLDMYATIQARYEQEKEDAAKET